MINEKFYRIKDRIKTTGKYRGEYNYISVSGTSDISDLIVEFKSKTIFGSPVDKYEQKEITQEEYIKRMLYNYEKISVKIIDNKIKKT